MKSPYKIFRESVREIRAYYMLLVEETKSARMVGSTNEWVLDNYYMISEEEKGMKVELKGIESGVKKVERERVEMIWGLTETYLRKVHYRVEKELLFRQINMIQKKEDDWLTYGEVEALPLLIKAVLIKGIADLCVEMRSRGGERYLPTDKGLVDEERLNMSASENLQMMNMFTSLKKMSKLPLAELIESVSYSERMLRGEKAGMYDQMYDKTKEDYREKVIRGAKKLGMKEAEYVKDVVERADTKGEHVGWQLFPGKRWNSRAVWYVVIVIMASLLLSVGVGYSLCLPWPLLKEGWWFVLLALLLWVPMSQVVIDVFNQLLYKIHKPVNTFKMKFKDGVIPDEYTTMVIMPTILKNGDRVRELLEVLEVYFLSNINRGDGPEGLRGDRGQNLYYTLVGDAAAYSEEDAPWDEEVVEAGLSKVKELNEKYGGNVFNFVYRRRAWSEGEGVWLGHERKRGAILHFNDLLLGNTSNEEKQKRFRCETISEWLGKVKSEKFNVKSNDCPIRFVITLDTDTELVLYSAQKLIGAMAHPLNRAVLSSDGKRVDRGYGIMQPRVNVDVEVTNKSRYAQLMAGLGGLDVYTTASFELYQDIFNEGSFCGKGIYDLAIFQKVLKGTFPENLILSHDLIEGCHIRCGLINDVELFDDNPSNWIDDAKRHHRWTRGDWQIIGWLRRKVWNEKGEKVKNQVNTIGRWKIFDNLRRSVLSLSLVVLIIACYAMSMGGVVAFNPGWSVVVAVIVVASPIVFFILGQVTKMPSFGKRYHYYATLLRGFKVILYRWLVQFALLPKEAWMYSDAAIRSCYRMLVSHKNLLNWITSDEASKSTKGTLWDYVCKFWPNYLVSALLVLLGITSSGIGVFGWIGIVFCVMMWCLAPIQMWWLGKKFPQERRRLSEDEREEVRELAKETWHYFDTLITEENNWLVPDNYQLTRENRADYKTSPTNIGFSLTALVSAARMGFISEKEALMRMSNIVETVCKLEKWNGHLFNWYDIKTLEKLPNYFVSTCDSGNFVACLHVVKGWLEELRITSDELRVKSDNGLMRRVERLIDETDFSKLYNEELDVFSIGYDWGSRSLLPYHYNNFASEARLTSYMTIAQGHAPYKHWFCLDKTLVQYRGYKGVASWYGTLFEYFMPLIFLPTYKHTLMDETYSFAIRAQRAFVGTGKGLRMKGKMPWGISETAYNELDDAQNYKYHAFGVPYLKFQNTTPDRIVISPYSSLMTIGIDDRAVYDNMQLLNELGMRDKETGMGYFESYDEEDHVTVEAHYAHHQGMILASLTNYLSDGCIQRYFMHEPMMRSMETLLKEKAQVKPYIDLKVTQYKRYQYSKVQTESDARTFDGIAQVPEIGVLSNGEYTVLLNDRGSGFSRFKNIYLNRYRKISADHYGNYLFVRNLKTDKLWSATYAPLDEAVATYRVDFASDKIRFLRSDNGIETCTEITVLKDRAGEIRRYTFTNNTNEDIDLELTTYSEVVLAPRAEDENHRVFAGMKVKSEYDEEHRALLFVRPGAGGSRNHMLHKLWLAESKEMPEYETSRLKFLGRGGSLQHSRTMEGRFTLSSTVGTTLDPIMAMRIRIHVGAGEQEEAYALTGFSKSREQLLQLTEQYQNEIDISYAFETASVYNNMRAAASTLKGVHTRLYNSLSKYIGQTATLGSGRAEVLKRNTLSQSGLWRFGISGDYAIVLMEIDGMEHSGFAKEMLRAFEYYKIHGLVLDLVFILDTPKDERDAMRRFIDNMASTEHLWSSHITAGKVYVLDGDDVSEAERVLLKTVARLTFNTHPYTIEQQLLQLEAENQHYQDKIEYPLLTPKRERRVWSGLDFYNQYGGFDNGGRDYVVTNTNTPMPWVNVITNSGSNSHGVFGTIVSSTMAGFTFAHNAQQFKLTGWSNDVVRDNASEMLLVNKSQFVPATARHSQGWSAFDAEYENMKVNIRVFVATDKAEKYYQIKIENKLDEPQDVRLDMVYKLVMGDSEERTARYLYSEWDDESNTLKVRNVYHSVYRDETLLLTATEPLKDVSLNYPNRKRLGMKLELPAMGEREVAYVLSVGTQATNNIKEINAEYEKVLEFWEEKLSAIQVSTPDRSFDYMINHWYLYQVYASRLYARAGFYQVGGATGFRDQLQDVMSILYSDAAYARRQILEHACHQFAEGDVLHWWHTSLKMGTRTTFSDDYLWLVFVTYQYVKVTGDTSILDVRVPFCQGDQLQPGETERGMNYVSGCCIEDSSTNTGEGDFEYATLYQHLQRSISRAMSRIGSHGLPLMGCGDWNDGMSSVGAGGKGESVWVALFLADLLPKMQELTETIPGADLSYCEELMNFRTQMVQSIQKSAWDGAWFLRAFYDDGSAMGSRNNTECQIDLISQAWSILTDVATEDQKRSVIRESDARLVNREHEIIQLLTPAFQNSKPSPGYIMNYPVGVRENGGQYTHGAMWYIMALLKEGMYDNAYYLYSIINPIHRTGSLADVLKYKVEPYCIAADIYSNPQHPGRGGWTWYTGSASWAYKTGIENILGLHKEGDKLRMEPKVPSEWKEFTVRYRYGKTDYIIKCHRSQYGNSDSNSTIHLVDDGGEHVVECEI